MIKKIKVGDYVKMLADNDAKGCIVQVVSFKDKIQSFKLIEPSVKSNSFIDPWKAGDIIGGSGYGWFEYESYYEILPNYNSKEGFITDKVIEGIDEIHDALKSTENVEVKQTNMRVFNLFKDYLTVVHNVPEESIEEFETKLFI